MSFCGGNFPDSNPNPEHLLLIETHREPACISMGQHLACLWVLHDLSSSLNTFSWMIFPCDKKNHSSFCTFKIWRQNVKTTRKWFLIFFFKFSSILNKLLRNQTLVSIKKHSFSDDSSLLFCVVFLWQRSGSVEWKRVGWAEGAECHPVLDLHA